MTQDEDFKKKLADYFTATELIDLLDVTIEEVIDSLWFAIEDQKEELHDYINGA